MASPQGPLPPLGADGADSETGTAPPKPRRKRQPRPATDDDTARDSGEATVEGDAGAPVKPRRRRQRPQTATEEQPAENADDTVAEGTVASAADSAAPQRRRRKRKPQAGAAAGAGVAGSQRGQTNFALDVDLDDLKDDIVVITPTTINVGTASNGQPSVGASYVKSTAPAAGTIQIQPGLKPAPISGQQPTSQQDAALYIEERKKFRKTDKDQLQKEADARLQMQIVERRKSLLDASVTAHVIFSKFANFCEGLLAGFALWHIVVVAVMMNTLNYTPLVSFVFQFYGPFSNGASAFFVILLYFSLINSMDRIDVAAVSRRCGIKCATFQMPGICVVLYMAALILQMVCVPMDDQMWILYFNSTSTSYNSSTSTALGSSITSTWYPVTIAKAVLVIIAWFLLSSYPYKDRLKENLLKRRAEQAEFDNSPTHQDSDRRALEP